MILSAKGFYRKLIDRKKKKIISLEKNKTFLSEWYAIFRKRTIYKDIKWTREQKLEFNNFWKLNYGKKISSRWHKLYQKINGVFNPEYVPEILYTTKIEPKLNPFFKTRELSDKNLIELLIAKKLNENIIVPETVLVVSEGVMYNGEREVISEIQAQALLNTDIPIVIKPTIGSSSGNGVQIFDRACDVLQNINDLVKIYKNNFIVQRKIIQAEELAKIYDKAINTFRITTYYFDGKIYHCPIMLRIGTGGSVIDNIHAGGIGIHVKDNGVLAKYAFVLGYGDKTQRLKSHPDSGFIFEGYKFSFIKEMISVLYSLHGCFSGIGIISWDITVDNQGRFNVIEANLSGQGIWFPQMISGESVFKNNTREILNLFKV